MTEKKTNQKVAPCKTNTENTFLLIYAAISRLREIITGKWVGIWQGRLIELFESLNVFKIILNPKSLHWYLQKYHNTSKSWNNNHLQISLFLGKYFVGKGFSLLKHIECLSRIYKSLGIVAQKILNIISLLFIWIWLKIHKIYNPEIKKPQQK